MKYILVYGSLRKNSKRGYNFNRFGGQTYIKDIELAGFDMYDLGSYPAIGYGTHGLKCELHSITDDSYDKILRMEVAAGYNPVILKGLEHEPTVFVLNQYIIDKIKQKSPLVASGDWD